MSKNKIGPRGFLFPLGGVMLASIGLLLSGCLQPARIPVILDTDIGSDIDDTWALAMILCSPELDLKLVTTDSGNTVGKARIAAQFLERVGRTDVPIGIGRQISEDTGPLGNWAAGYDLARYPGRIHPDGVQAIIDAIMQAPRPTTLLAIGPVPNLAEALRREPRIARRARLVAMGGSVERQYDGRPGRCAEWNVKADPTAARTVYTADWEVTLAPLDTAGVVRLTGPDYSRVRDSDNPIARTVIECYRAWARNIPAAIDPEVASSVLFDTVAVQLVVDRKWCAMRDLRIRVTDGGFTEASPDGKLMHLAMTWKDLGAFHRLIAERLTCGQ